MLRHRLNSIYYDKLELDRLFEKFPQIPVIANLRCGSWYCSADKNLTNHACYFKSTDGHDKQWDFNIRRLNSHFLEFIYKHNTVFVVDSTGNPAKVYPDALSKTIPIWATVMNRLFCADDDKSVILPDVISERESRELHETVERKINDWVELAKSVLPEHLLELTKQKNHNNIKKIIPIFVSSRHSFDPSVLMDDSTIKIICVSAGSSNTTRTDDTYILGAGDDEEMWSHGLTAEMFWNQPGEFLKCATDAELEAYIREMLRSTHELCIQNEVMNDPIYGKISVSTTTTKAIPETNEILIVCDTRTITLNYTMKLKNIVYDVLCSLSSLYTTSYTTIHISGSNTYINIAICCAIAIFNYKYNTIRTGQNTITKAFIRNVICRICAAAGDFKLFPRRYCRELNTFFISRDMYQIM